jgi:hypothetical protein
MPLQKLYMAGSNNYVKKLYMWDENLKKFVYQTGQDWTGGASDGFDMVSAVCLSQIGTLPN